MFDPCGVRWAEQSARSEILALHDSGDVGGPEQANPETADIWLPEAHGWGWGVTSRSGGEDVVERDGGGVYNI